jgi:hypothetical protein
VLVCVQSFHGLAIGEEPNRAEEAGMGRSLQAVDCLAHGSDGDYLDVPVTMLHQALQDSYRIFTSLVSNSPARLGLPGINVGRYRPGLRYSDPTETKLDSTRRRVFLPKLGWIRYRNSRQVIGEVRSSIIKRVGKRCHVSIQVECDCAPPVPSMRTEINLDPVILGDQEWLLVR